MKTTIFGREFTFRDFRTGQDPVAFHWLRVKFRATDRHEPGGRWVVVNVSRDDAPWNDKRIGARVIRTILKMDYRTVEHFYPDECERIGRELSEYAKSLPQGAHPCN